MLSIKLLSRPRADLTTVEFSFQTYGWLLETSSIYKLNLNFFTIPCLYGSFWKLINVYIILNPDVRMVYNNYLIWDSRFWSVVNWPLKLSSTEEPKIWYIVYCIEKAYHKIKHHKKLTFTITNLSLILESKI